MYTNLDNEVFSYLPYKPHRRGMKKMGLNMVTFFEDLISLTTPTIPFMHRYLPSALWVTRSARKASEIRRFYDTGLRFIASSGAAVATARRAASRLGLSTLHDSTCMLASEDHGRATDLSNLFIYLPWRETPFSTRCGYFFPKHFSIFILRTDERH